MSDYKGELISSMRAAVLLDISLPTFYKRAKDDPEFPKRRGKLWLDLDLLDYQARKLKKARDAAGVGTSKAR